MAQSPAVVVGRTRTLIQAILMGAHLIRIYGCRAVYWMSNSARDTTVLQLKEHMMVSRLFMYCCQVKSGPADAVFKPLLCLKVRLHNIE